MTSFLQPPTVVAAEAAPLAGVLTATTDEIAVLTVRYGTSGDTRAGDAAHTGPVDSGDAGDAAWCYREVVGEPGLRHRLVLVGMPAASDIDIIVTCEGKSDNPPPVHLRHRTPALPPAAEFPALRVRLADAAADDRDAHLLLCACMRIPDPPRFPAEDPEFGLLIALDDRGEVVWYYQAPHIFGLVLPLKNGRLLLGDNAGDAFEIDWEGNMTRRWLSQSGHAHVDEAIKHDPTYAQRVPDPIRMDTRCLHHGWRELPNGNLLALSVTARQVPDFPHPPSDPALLGPRPLPPAMEPPWVVADEIVEFRGDGEIVSRLSVFDLLDVERVSHDFFIPFWTMVGAYPLAEYGATRDWSHGSGIAEDETSGICVVTFRHLDVIAGIDRAGGELVWLLGDPTGWREPWASKLLRPLRSATGGDDPGADPGGDASFGWPYHMHSPIITRSDPSGVMRVMVFDNGLRRTVYPDPGLAPEDSYSRAVEFEIDPVAMTVRTTWDWRGEESFLSTVVSSVFVSEDDNRVIVTDGLRPRDEHGNRVYAMGGHPSDAVVSVVDRHTKQTRLEVLVEPQGNDGLLGWAVYQSVSIPDFAPTRATPDTPATPPTSATPATGG